MAIAIFAAGCFWGVEAYFRKLPGVLDTEAGYIGGEVANPTYEQVCTGRTGHAEAVRVIYDPELITYTDLLVSFWQCHDPTQLNRQGLDLGTQYRSAIFTQDRAQYDLAIESLARENASGRYRAPLATEVVMAETFWLAESDHQQYFARRKAQVTNR